MRDFRDARGNEGDWVGALQHAEDSINLRAIREILEIIARANKWIK
jgi:hypothetical protein